MVFKSSLSANPQLWRYGQDNILFCSIKSPILRRQGTRVEKIFLEKRPFSFSFKLFLSVFPFDEIFKKKDRAEREESEVLTKRIAACNSLFMVHQMGKWEWRQRSDGWGKIGRGNSLFPEKSETIAFFRARQRFKTMWHRVRARLHVNVRFFKKRARYCGLSMSVWSKWVYLCITIGAFVPNIKVSFLDFKVHNPVVVVYWRTKSKFQNCSLLLPLQQCSQLFLL